MRENFSLSSGLPWLGPRGKGLKNGAPRLLENAIKGFLFELSKWSNDRRFMRKYLLSQFSVIFKTISGTLFDLIIYSHRLSNHLTCVGVITEI